MYLGHSYAKKMQALAKSDPQAFICHYYNFYFAHTAGGRMIGNKVRCLARATVPLVPPQTHRRLHAHLHGQCSNALACCPDVFTVCVCVCVCAQVSEMILDKHTLKFYQWEGDVNTHLDAVSSA